MNRRFFTDTEYMKLQRNRQLAPNARTNRRYISHCPICELEFTHNSERQETCSPACRMKKSRIQAGRASNRSEAAQRGVTTKLNTIVTHTCEMCGREFQRSQTSANVQFCSNACKQRNYRARKAAK